MSTDPVGSGPMELEVREGDDPNFGNYNMTDVPGQLHITGGTRLDSKSLSINSFDSTINLTAKASDEEGVTIW